MSAPHPRMLVRPLENKSFEPNLEVRLTNYLRHDFPLAAEHRLSRTTKRQTRFDGQILAVSLPTLVSRNDDP